MATNVNAMLYVEGLETLWILLSNALCTNCSHCLPPPARHALLQPARRALLPCASRPTAASASRLTAARAPPSAGRCAAFCSPLATFSSSRADVAARSPPLQPARHPCSPLAIPAARSQPVCGPLVAPAARSPPVCGPFSAPAARLPPFCSPLAPPCLRRPAAAAAAAARAIAAAGGGSTGSTGARPGGGGFGFLRTAQRRQQSQQENFSPQVLSELFPQRYVTGSVEAAALDASESAAAIGASESAAALGASESAVALGARASLATGPSLAEALHTFTLDSGASRCFFRDCTTLTPLAAPVPISLADPTGGPVVGRASTVIPCPAVPSGSLSGLHLPTFSTNLVSNAAIQDVWVDTSIPGGQRVAI
ncbi:unnamed protein product, partial [Closterium sp. NIES-54]